MLSYGSRCASHLLAAGLLLLLFGLLVAGIRPLTLTADEPAHIAGGYALLQQGRAAFPLLAGRGYPPLLVALEGALFTPAEPDLSITQLDGWPEPFDIFVRSFAPQLAPQDRTAFGARMPTVWLTVLMGAVVFRWAKDLWGPQAGVLALLALALDPNVLAHGRLANTDAGTTAMGTAALYAAWRWSRRPAWRGAAITGLLMGLTLLCKISGPLWVLSGAAIMLSGAVKERRARNSLPHIAAALALSALISALVLWAGYGFSWGYVPGLPVPLPAPAYWRSGLYLTGYTADFFALGRYQYGRWWWYFPAAFLIKNPLPLLMSCLIGLRAFARRPRARRPWRALVVFPLLYAGVAILTGMNIGYRHMLPVHPFLHLLAGGGLALWLRGGARRWRNTVALLLGLWYAAGTLAITPHELTFFNALAGGPTRGYRYLVDSNLAWGQAGKALAAYERRHPEARAEPPATPFRPAPGRYIVDASYLQGVGISDPFAYAWFRQREPQETVANSLLVYEVPAFERAWFAQCASPLAPLEAAAVRGGLGETPGLRTPHFDCAETWLYPAGGRAAGIYALDTDQTRLSRGCGRWPLPCPPEPADPFVARHLAGARRSFVHRDFVLYEAQEIVEAPVPPAIYAAPAATPPEALLGEDALRAPVALAGPLDFLGAAAYAAEGHVDVETWWRVTDGPITRALSIMAHRVTPAGALVEDADGLGVWPPALAVGDVVVQRHRFAGGAPEGLWLRAGVYWLDTLARWLIAGEPEGADAVFLKLEARTQ